MKYRAQYKLNGGWVWFTVYGRDINDAFDNARAIVGEGVGLAVFGAQQ